MKILPESKAKRVIYLVTAILWGFVFYVSSLLQCASTSIPQYLAIFLATFIFVVLAWNYSLERDLRPSSFVNISKIFINSTWNFIYISVLSLLVVIPISVFTPAYTCYNDRAANAEVLALLSGVKLSVTELIEKNDGLENDYLHIKVPSFKRLEYFEVNKFGRILVHANSPEFKNNKDRHYKEIISKPLHIS